jgi:hypothetical protein
MPRAASAAVGLLGLVLWLSASAPAAGTAPTITLLTPPNHATITSSIGSTPPKFTWKVDWTAPESTAVRLEIASDTAFTQNTDVETHFCDASNVNCWTQVQLNRVYGPPYGSVWYWRVGLTTSNGIVYSETFTFTAVSAPDRDKDGIPDGRDNCPGVSNANQADSNHNGKGDACEPDRTRPRVKVLAGSGRRGEVAFLTARVADDRGSVRLSATLAYHGHVLYRGRFGWAQTDWATPHTFYTQSKLPRSLPTGAYSACVKAWDRAGNSAHACAPYSIR